MGIIVVGTLYEKNWGGINFTQPNGPYTQVFPAEAINVPFASYPVPGNIFAENSGVWQAGCSHSINLPLVFFDFNAFVITLAFLQDSLGRNWQIGITNDGTQITATQVTFTANSVVLFTDQVTQQTWQLSVIPNTDGSDVDLQLTAVGGSGGQNQLLVQSPNASLYAIQVSNGVLQTAFAQASEGQSVAIICCEICTYCQYVIPQELFYDSFRNPVTII